MAEVAPEIITSLPPEFMREFEAEILGQIPEEKVKADLRQAEIGRQMKREGSVKMNGLGQKVAEIDPRLYFRMRQDFGNKYEEREWVRDFLADNPAMCAPGYRPRRKRDLRHSLTMVAGEPVRMVKSPLNATVTA